jgi:hypothetical protein
MGKLFNLARMDTATTGTGTITLGSAVSGYLTFALAGVTDGDVVSYGIKDGAASEVGTGTYTASGTTLTRTVTKSTNSDAALNLSGSAEVFITARAQDFITPFGFSNASIAVSAAAGALTIALKDNAGADPSVTSPASFWFRNVTGATGSWSQIDVTAATSLVISSGSTLGVTSSTAFRLWVVGFNDGGTFRLGVVNCFISPGNIFALNNFALVSSTAEGGAGARDSAGEFVTGTAVTSKAYVILGYVEWNTSGVTAGTWTTTNVNLVQTFGYGVPKPGDVVQTAYTRFTTYTSGSANWPNVATVPLNSYGDQFLSRAITPTSAANNLEIDGQIFVSAGGACLAQAGVFQDSVTNGLAQSGFQITTAGAKVPIIVHHEMKAGTTSSTTFGLRAGTNSGGTMHVNGAATGATGTVQSTYIRVSETMA